jgi:hypothetical protein
MRQHIRARDPIAPRSVPVRAFDFIQNVVDEPSQRTKPKCNIAVLANPKVQPKVRAHSQMAKPKVRKVAKLRVLLHADAGAVTRPAAPAGSRAARPG